MIHILHKQGYSKKAIAKQLDLSINTVRKYLRSGSEPVYSPRPSSTKPAKLDAYKAYIQQRLKETSPHWVPASVIGREIKALGYEGSSSLLRAYMQTLKPKQPLCTLRYETEPGYQMQVDWAEFRRGPQRLSAFIATLGYSRASYVEFVTDETLDTLLHCHEQAFDYFGGVPYSVLYDNMKTVIIERNAYGTGQHRFQAGFWDYAKHRGFMPKVCKPYRPQTKGKVERFIHYLKHSFYFPLLGQFKGQGLCLDKQTANAEVLKWLHQVANQRLHATTHAIPFERLQKERLQLQPLGPCYPGQRLIIPSITDDKPWLVEFNAQDNVSFQHELSIYQQLLEPVLEGSL